MSPRLLRIASTSLLFAVMGVVFSQLIKTLEAEPSVGSVTPTGSLAVGRTLFHWTDSNSQSKTRLLRSATGCWGGSYATTVAGAMGFGRAHATPLSETSSPTTAPKNRCGLNYFLTSVPSPEALRPRLGNRAIPIGKWRAIRP